MFLLSPLDTIRPSDLLAQYSEWVYFTLLLIFFISLTGLALRKHFDRAYAKPLIVAVGLMMTAGTFMWKDTLTILFEGWGIIGTLLLVFIVATIPYALCRGFGMSGQRAFFVVYALFYLLSWMKFPFIYSYLGNNNMGLVNLTLLVLFVYAVYKILTGWKSSGDLARGFDKKNPLTEEISEEIYSQETEANIVGKEEHKVAKFELKTITDIEESIVEMIQIIETHNANLNTSDRKRIAETLKRISREEALFLKPLQNLKQLLKRLSILDEKQINEMNIRLNKTTGGERQSLGQEILMEKEKIKAEANILASEKGLEQLLDSFNILIRQATQVLNSAVYPADALPVLSKARLILKDILNMIEKMRYLEDKLLQFTKNEEKLLKNEKNSA